MKNRLFLILFGVIFAHWGVSAILGAWPVWAAVRLESGGYIVDDAQGFAPVKDGNRNAAREEAKREAYRDALEKALGAMVTGVTEMENYAVVRDKVFSQTSGIVKQFEIVNETIDDDGVLQLTALCQVSAAALDGVLGPAVLDAIGNPRVMVLMDERIGEKSSFLSASEAVVLSVFERAGYLLVDPDQARTLIKIDPATAYDDPEKIMDAARTLRADVIILGKAYGNVFHQGKVEGITMYGVNGTVQLKAVHTRSAYQISSKTVEQSTGKKPALSVEDGAARCFQEAARLAAVDVVHKIAYALVSGTAGGVPGITVNVKIANISFKEVQKLEENLRELIGKNGNVYEREYKDGTVEMDVVSEKTAQNIASFLSESGLEVEGLTAQTISAKVDEAPAELSAEPPADEISVDVPAKKSGGVCGTGVSGIIVLVAAICAVGFRKRR